MNNANQDQATMEVYLNLINSVIHVVESLMSQEELPDALAEEKDDLISIY